MTDHIPIKPKRSKYPNGIFSATHFIPAGRLIHKGSPSIEDLWELKGFNKTEIVSEYVTKKWQKELGKDSPSVLGDSSSQLRNTPSLIGVLLSTSSGILSIAIVYLFFNMIMQTIPSIVLPFLIDWLIQPTTEQLGSIPELGGWIPPDQWGWIYAGIIGLSYILSSYLESHGMLLAQESITRIRASIIHLIYQKVLQDHDGSQQSGKVMTLLTSDVNIIGMTMPQVFQYIMTPFQLILIMVLLWLQIGPYSLISLGFIVLILPVAGVAGMKMYSHFDKRQSASDTHLKLVSEFIHAIRIIKFYAWETPIVAKIEESRKHELHMLLRALKWAAVVFMTTDTSPIIATVLTYVFYTLYSTPNLTAIFTTLNLLGLLRYLSFMLPTMLQGITQILACINRIQDYLIETPSVKRETPSKDCSPVDIKKKTLSPYIELKAASFAWNSGENALKDITLRVDSKSRLTMITGLVGSGKSAIIKALLGQLSLGTGSSVIEGSIAYVSQTAWILNNSIRENILFGEDFNEDEYQKVIQAVSLTDDLKSMPLGDMTEIGERGVTLSGGQKQRISLARALYSDNDIYLLDDPLSAVDAHVGKHILREGIIKFLKDKIVVLVTNNLQFLPEADQIVYLDRGSVMAIGKFKEILHKNSKFKKLMMDHGVLATLTDVHNRRSNHSTNKVLEKSNTLLVEKLEEIKTIGYEDTAVGTLSNRVYNFYIRNAGILNFIMVCLTIGLQNAVQVVTTWWLMYWANDYSSGNHNMLWYIGIYTGLNLSTVVFLALMFIFVIKFTLQAARNLHTLMLNRVSKAPISFFDSTPIGRIIARFSTDLTIIDTQILASIWYTLNAFFSVLAMIASVAIGTYWILVAIPPFILAYFLILWKYRKTSIEIQRLEAVTRAPLFSHFSETLNGIDTIRAYSKEFIFSTENTKRLDLHNSVYFSLRYTQAWLNLVLSYLGAGLQVLIYFLIVTLKVYSIGDSNATVGSQNLFVIAVSSAPQITMMLKILATAIAMLDIQMNSVERIQEYGHLPLEGVHLPVEGKTSSEITDTESPTLSPVGRSHKSLTSSPDESSVHPSSGDSHVSLTALSLRERSSVRPQDGPSSSHPPSGVSHASPTDWPNHGSVEFKDFSYKYGPELPLVLNKVSLKISGGERIGIVGRTGSGKSTLISMLYRLDEATEGSILIDGVDISTLDLHTLRSNLSIIPQDPHLFTGTLRYNLDPLDQHTDEQLWQALEIAGLKSHITSLSDVKSDYSIGQRQLICLARALLRKSKILVLDEATASVDFDTDTLIQKAIRMEFPNTTLLIIAHRLNTVMDMDRILGLSQGIVKEFDTPKVLVSNKKSMLYGMIKVTGKTSAKHLKRLVLGTNK